MENQHLLKDVEKLANQRIKLRASELIAQERSISAILDIDDVLGTKPVKPLETKMKDLNVRINSGSSKEASTVSDITNSIRKNVNSSHILYKDYHKLLDKVPSDKDRLKLIDMIRLTKYTRGEVFKILLANERQFNESTLSNSGHNNERGAKGSNGKDLLDADWNPRAFNAAFIQLLGLEKIDILTALRQFTYHVELYGESQKVDSGLKLFAREFYEANSKFYRNQEDIYKIAMNLILLNTMINSNINEIESEKDFVKNTLNSVKENSYESELIQHYRSLIINPMNSTHIDRSMPSSGLRKYVENFEGEIFDFMNAKISKWHPDHKWRSYNPQDSCLMKKLSKESASVMIVLYRTHIRIIRHLGKFEKINFGRNFYMPDVINPIYLMHAEAKRVNHNCGSILISQQIPDTIFYLLKVKGNEKVINNLVMNINFMAASCSSLPRKNLINRLTIDSFPLKFDFRVDKSLLLSLQELGYKERIYSYVIDILFKFFTCGLQNNSILSDDDILFQSYITVEINRFNNYVKILRSGLNIAPKVELNFDN